MNAAFQVDLRAPAQFSEGGTVQRGPFIRTVSARIDRLIHYLYVDAGRFFSNNICKVKYADFLGLV